MKFEGSLIAVTDIEKSKKFYQELLSQKIALDLGRYVWFEGSVSLMTKELWLEQSERQEKDLSFGANSCEVYFEEEKFDDFLSIIHARQDITYVHDVKEFPWGQRSIRFYDPDRHIVEVGETMQAVARKFLKQGMSPEETAERIMFPLEFVLACVDKE